MSILSKIIRFDHWEHSEICKLVSCWANDQKGATAVEYALILALVFLGMVGALYTFGDQLGAMFTYLASTISAALK